MKSISKLLLVVLPLFANAQDLKVKKGDIFLDDKLVAKIEKSEPLFYKVSNLDASYSVVVNHLMCDVANYAYLEIKNGDNKNQINYAKFSPFNVEKSIVQTLVKENFITVEGFNSMKLKEFLTSPFNDLGKQYGCEFLAEEIEYGKRNNVVINDNGEIIFGDSKVKIGYVTRSTSKDVINRDVYTYKVFDLKHREIAKVSESISNFSVKGNVTTFDNKAFLIGLKQIDSFTFAFSKDPNARSLVLKLLFNNYQLRE